MQHLHEGRPVSAGGSVEPSAVPPSGPSVQGRRFAGVALVAVLVVGVLSLRDARADPVLSPTATVSTSDGLNLRSGPGTSYDVIAVMPDGAQVTLTGQPTPDNWFPADYNGTLGWALGTYLELSGASAAPTAAAAAPAAPAAPTTATVTPPDGLNLRSGQGTSNPVLIVIPGGATVTVTGASVGGWAPVSYNGASGWVDASYLSSSPAPPTGGGPTITSASTSSSSGATIGAVPSGAAAGSGAAAYGQAAIGKQAPSESGLTIISAPADAKGRFAWPVDSREITTVFQPAHEAIDIDQSPSGGLPVRAAADGIVSFAGGDPCCSYGFYVIIQHPGGYASLYGHFSRLEVQQGQAVKQGQEIGRSGSTGHSTGPHVHFALYFQGKPFDPLAVLPSNGVKIMPGSNIVS